MENESLLQTVEQLQREVELLGVRGLRTASHEQLNWLRHTRATMSEMGAEFLAQKITLLLDTIDQATPSAAGCFLDLLTTIRVFERVLTLETISAKFHNVSQQP